MKDEFIIPLNGLKPGRTSFSWHVGKEFFRRFENTEIIDADIVADVVAEKSGSYLGVDCSLAGTLTVPCDRCMEDVVLPVDAQFVTSRHIKERLDKELEKNLALRVKPGLNADSFVVFGRGVLHLSVLIEEMRREGFELQVGQPKVLDKTINGQRCEPIEELSIEVPEQFVGAAIEISTRRKAALIHMEPRADRTLLEFEIPTRGLMGLRSNLLTASQGEAVVAHRFKDYQPYKGEIEHRTNGSLVSLETGEAIAYSMNKLLDRGKFFVDPGEEIYMGEVVGEHTRDRDLNVNICKTKKLTNVRAAGSDEKIILPPPIKMSLEEMLEYINEDELVEVTPHHLRIRKVLLDPTERKRKSGDED